MARLGAHPRLAHAMIEAAACGDAESRRNACLLAAILSEGPAADARHSSNIAHLLGDLETPRGAIAPAARQRIRELAKSWERDLDRLAVAASAPRPLSVGILLAWAYPDRIGTGRKLADDEGRYRLSGGRGAKLRPGDPLAASDWICVAEIDDRDADATIRLAAPITQAEVERHFSHLFHTVAVVAWNTRSKRVDAAERDMFGEVQVRERPLKDLDDAAVLACLCDGIRQEGLERLNWTPAARNVQARIRVVAAAMPQEALPDVSDDALAATLEHWLGPVLYGMRTLAQAAEVDLVSPLLALLGPAARRLDTLAPTHLRVPSGSNIRIDYTEAQPSVSVRIQEVFGMTATPTIADGRIPLLLKLLSPAQRPVQVTADLESFWKNGYPEVRKDLRGRYPRHYWPEDPSQAVATRRVRPKGGE
jgi:ATP-dependent helicase HrpB